MELRWLNRKTKEIGITNVTDDDTKILGFIGYEHCHEEDLNDEEGLLVEIWKPF